MKTIVEILSGRVSEAMEKVTGEADCQALVRQSQDARFGDYQSNGVMGLAKRLKTNPRELAGKIVAELDVSDMCEEPEVAGPGFINFTLKNEFIGGRLAGMDKDAAGRLGIDSTEEAKKVVVDFSAPNIAKQMHVGHLRSTIIGDCICRLMEFRGHEVVRQNHIGDWGTQFGMLIAYLKDENPEVIDKPETVEIADLEQFYKNAKKRCDEDPAFEAKARSEVVKLHNHAEDTLTVWKHIVDESRKHYQPIYDMLGVDLDESNERGESFYADRLAGVVEELKTRGVAIESEGAVCVFPEGFKNKEGDPLPFIVQKSDGAFLYATTDMAALQYRLRELGADKVIYVTDGRQQLHFKMLFASARMADWVSEDAELMHVWFGTMLGEDGKPFKTRSGKTIKLRDLLSEAVERARGVVEEKNPGLNDEQKDQVARAVGIGAVKYADFSNNRTTDYVFSFDRMLSMDGNTAPYMQYAYARVKSIERKAEEKGVDIAAEVERLGALNVSEPAEVELGKHIMRYGEAIASASADCRPNFLTSYLYDLAQKFSSFYSACPVLGADEDKRATRLVLCDLTANVIRHGLSELLGIDVVEQM
ncbi:Arginine--tRNA ligase [Anaerohalosphaera lusitana]|uniref:Arginine--tRNA ligase n=1 Tax=Anaerohalosphaera lusitana TaxID=1936003 RepID=A0A1U9NHW8_9BACT|nr:arginine--tRNA ligase [Anaerohalosphaera lusitana]AQT67521.1 Arginine--tRNA ligase [Anaerohalosphaera lusitana]